LGFLEPVAAFVASFIFLGILIYRRVALGITLNLTAIVLSMLFLELIDVGNVFWETLTDFVTISLVLATFGIMLLSQLYKETGFVTTLSQSLSEIVRNSKLVMSILPAVMGLLPVPGCAIISAPMIEAEAKRLKLDKARQTYVNVWFRHTILPVYPMSPFLILTGALTGLSIISLIFRQVPVVIAMLAIGYMVGFSKVPAVKHESSRRSLTTNLAFLLKAFTPILTMLFAMITLKIDAWIAAFLGVGVLLLMARPSLNVFSRPFRSRAIYEVALEAEEVGANVSGLMLRLNEAADWLFMAHSAFETGNFDEAIRLADLCGEISSEVRVEAQRLRAEADSEHAARFWWSLVGSFVGVAIVVSASVLGYVYFKRLYYRRLLKMRPRVEQV